MCAAFTRHHHHVLHKSICLELQLTIEATLPLVRASQVFAQCFVNYHQLHIWCTIGCLIISRQTTYE